MSRKGPDWQKFVKLQGLEEVRGWVKWGEIIALSLFLAGFILLVTDKLMAATEITEPAPYTGIVRNLTRVPVSVPSENSGAALIIPPGGWIEYTAWQPEFNLTAYFVGKPYNCQKVLVAPHSFKYQCADYDFLAEIRPPPPPPGSAPPLKKKQKHKKAPMVG